MKTIGARKIVLIKTTAIEYGVLGVLAGCIGSLAAIALTWAMTRSSRPGIPWHLQPTVNIVGVAVTVLLVTAVGIIATWDVLTRKPIATLREQ